MSENKITFNSDEQKVSYGFGLQFGHQLLKNQFDGLDAEMVKAGIQDILQKNKVQIAEADLNKAFDTIKHGMQEKQAKKDAQFIELGISFLQENAKREGVQVTESGLQYEVLEEGTGNKPTQKNLVETHYHGTFIDGTVFDSSVDRNEPATFGVTEVIKGWTEVLQMMPEGSKWRIAVPSELAYGETGAPPSVPAHAVLVFDIHLIKIIG